jgi:hypothetical protein
MPIPYRNRIRVSRRKTIKRINPAKIGRYVSVTKLQVTFTRKPATKPQRGSRSMTTLSLTSILDGGRRSTSRPGHFTPGKDPVPIVQKEGWALR